MLFDSKSGFGLMRLPKNESGVELIILTFTCFTVSRMDITRIVQNKRT